ncbi:polysaccharide pyruvyl transferase family protein [Geodermatophilus sp. SYSU D00705]
MSEAVAEIQRRSIDVLGRFLGPGEQVALLDFPSHQNAGDSLIYLGESEYLERLGVSVQYVADIARFDVGLLRRRLQHNSTLLLNGGGNLGDRWSDIQLFRERIIEAFPDRRIIQLPQSTDFSEAESLQRTQAVFGSHPDLILMMREQRSLAFAREHFSAPGTTVVHCPDAAFGVGVHRPAAPPTVDVLALLRRDSEAVTRSFDFPGLEVLRDDWGLSGWRDRQWRLSRVPGRLQRYVPKAAGVLYPAVARSYELQARINIRDAIEKLSRGRVVVTDRLHAAVLGGLCGLPVVALDNAYGKVSGVYEDYLCRLPNVRFASDAPTARQLVMNLLEGDGDGPAKSS